MAKHELNDLIGTAEIGALTGVTSAAVSGWRTRHKDFPRPLVEFRTGPLYSKREVVAWLRRTGRLETKPTRVFT